MLEETIVSERPKIHDLRPHCLNGSSETAYYEERGDVGKMLFPKLINTGQIPDNIYQIYDETYRSICNRHVILAGLGIRLIVELICKQKGANQQTLYGRIGELVDMGVLTRDGADILHYIRVVGGTSTHDSVRYREEALVAAINVLNYLLLAVYVLPFLNALLKSE